LEGIPNDFEMQISEDASLMNYKAILKYSGTLNKIILQDSASLFTALMDFSAGKAYYHSLLQGCVVAQNPNNTIKIDIGKLRFFWDITSTYVKTEANYDYYNASEFLHALNIESDLFLLFDATDHTLKYIELSYEGQHVTLTVDQLIAKHYTLEDFKLPVSWGCDTAKPLSIADFKNNSVLAYIAKIMGLGN